MIECDNNSTSMDVVYEMATNDIWRSWNNVADYFEYQPWVFSLLGSAMVGLSGVFPLFIIPIDEGTNLKHGPGAKTLKMLLSFAVGGLLGDVFLHLLPEAWENKSLNAKTVHGHPSMVCGLWVLIGFLVFIIAEKLFMETDDKETDDDQDIDCVKIKSQECDSETENNNFMPVNGQIKEKQKLSKNLGFTLPGKKDYDVNFVSVNSNKNDKSNDYNELCREMQRKELNDSAKPTKVFNRTSIKNGGMKTDVSNNLTSNGSIPDKLSNLNEPVKEKPKHISGYLNLLANCIDNFTHGLAVGGSFLVSFRLGSLTTFAILIHEIPHEVGDFAILLKSGFNRWDAARAQLMTATGGIFGALIAVLCSGSGVESRTSWILPFTAGGFLHIGLVTILPELLKESNPKESMKQLGALLSGITIMAILTIICD
ncbi:zinc transporter ZIP13 [Microplitis demolitor]|uniref:zinc transporter ZIP13 n=1 Tax=Microplitis demolitor TaxID=69319 RepID=UPI0004CDD254|nr:zinc transporter ZIP13 [Microplitis demolitor]XP_053597418.1 zinc transporter ZIP13 [Microplitis demolitor]XP_053597420.1 zinc transporter ZIP13 [Microplitis demolitor]